MSNPNQLNKITRERLEQLTKAVRHELSAFQLGIHIHEPIFGVVDLPMFGLRFKLVTNIVEGDEDCHVIIVTKLGDINSDSIFLLLARNGYLRWLRQQMGSNAYLKVLTHRGRWRLLLETALDRTREQKRGLYLTYLLRNMLDKPLLQIYHEDPEVFDWILR